MHTPRKNLLPLFLLLALALQACGGSSNSESELSPEDIQGTAVAVAATMIFETAEAARPTETATPLPPTATQVPTETPTITLTSTITLTPTITPIPPTETPNPNVLKNYFIALDTGGPVGCGDSLVEVGIGVLPSGDLETDVRVVLERLFNTKVMWFGGLYNPLYASNLQIESITNNKGDVLVLTTGTVVKGEDSCEWSRIRVQVMTTARKIPGVINIEIKTNGKAFNDLVSSDRSK